MTRNDILKNYEIINGMILSPGKFEGEMLYVPYYWDLFLNGGADSDNGKVLTFNVSDEDKVQFPELKKRKKVRLMEREDGFVVELKQGL